MPNFIRIQPTDLNDDGEPMITIQEEWVNLDQVTSFQTMLGDNLLRRRELGPDVPKRYYPLIELTTSDGRVRMISLGTYDIADDATEALNEFLPTLTMPGTTRFERDLRELLEN